MSTSNIHGFFCLLLIPPSLDRLPRSCPSHFQDCDCQSAEDKCQPRCTHGKSGRGGGGVSSKDGGRQVIQRGDDNVAEDDEEDPNNNLHRHAVVV
jgi:hypothetical protein